MNVHNLTIIASMCIAGVAISCGGWWAVAGVSWNLFVLLANITAPDKKSGDAAGKAVSHKTQFNTLAMLLIFHKKNYPRWASQIIFFEK